MKFTNKRVIPLSIPNLKGNEWKYVKDCLDTGWISSVGSYVNKFEEAVAGYAGAAHGVAVMNGTSALHTCLHLLGAGSGDYVLIPNVTFVATANAVSYTGAEPILVDADPDNWQMDLDLLESFLAEETETVDGALRLQADGRPIKAVMPVHIQGSMGDMDRFMEIVAPYPLPVVEDATEALGTSFQGRSAGTFGRMGCFSFNGNKIISTGGGGVIVTDDETLAQRAKHLSTTAKVDPLRYVHDELGFNYRLVNVLAAIGVAQMEQLDNFVARKKEVAAYYRSQLSGVGDIRFQEIPEAVDYNGWLFTIRTARQQGLLTFLNEHKILSRPFWTPMNKLPMYSGCRYAHRNDHSDQILRTCLSLPCSSGISDEELEIVSSAVKCFFRS
jgi:perosamine synthetase